MAATVDSDKLEAAAQAFVELAKRIRNKNGLEVSLDYSLGEAEVALCGLLGRRFGDTIEPGSL